jgi:dTDP-4-dehydrorhamnose 3,5-epimerase
MKILSITSLSVPDIKIIRFAKFSDSRGYFTEPFRKSDFSNHPEMGFMKGINFLQQNESYSKKNVIRGLHFQWNPYMGKMVRTIHGHMIDIVSDIRLGSPYYGKVIAYNMPMSVGNDYGEWIWVPPGFAHGNCFLEETTIEYFCSGEYSQGCEAGISPLSPDLDWSLCDGTIHQQIKSVMASESIVSDKDKAGLNLTSWTKDAKAQNFVYGQL